MGDAEFELLRTRGPKFFHCRELSRLLYRPDVDKAVDAMVNDPDDSYDKFMEDHTTTRLQMRKRKFDAVEGDGAADNQAATCDKAGPSQEKKAATKLYEGNVFMVSKDDTQYAVSNVDHVGEIWLTNSGEDYEAYDKKKRSFLTLWLSSKMGEELAKRSKPTNHLNDWTTLHTQTENTLLFKRVFDIIKSFKLWMKCACVKNIMPVGMSSMRLI